MVRKLCQAAISLEISGPPIRLGKLDIRDLMPMPGQLHAMNARPPPFADTLPVIHLQK